MRNHADMGAVWPAVATVDRFRAAGNSGYQRDLATALVAGLGLDAALETCRQNAWEGALGVLLDGRTAPATSGSTHQTDMDDPGA
jgi:hypothetical protein